MAWLSKLLLYIEVVLLGGGLLYACFLWKEIRFNKLSKYLIALYVIYFIFIYVQVFVSPQVPRGLMMDVPEDNYIFLQDFLIQSLSMLLVLGLRKYIDFTLLAKISVILTFLTFFAYFNKVDFRYYGMIDLADRKLSEGESIITSFKVAWYMVMAFFCGYLVKDKWSKSSIINSTVFYLFSVVFIFGLFLTSKRGPIMSFFAVLGFVLYLRYKMKSILICVFGVLIFENFVYDFLQANAFGLVSRFLLIEDGAGRFGSNDSVYSTAIRQIIESPVLGSYFRLLRVTYTDKGAYPHNIILELLMTGGLVLCIPFIIIIWKALRNSIGLLKLGKDQSLPALCFIYVLLSLMTSSSLLFKTEFWVFLAILCTYNENILRLKYE